MRALTSRAYNADLVLFPESSRLKVTPSPPTRRPPPNKPTNNEPIQGAGGQGARAGSARTRGVGGSPATALVRPEAPSALAEDSVGIQSGGSWSTRRWWVGGRVAAGPVWAGWEGVTWPRRPSQAVPLPCPFYFPFYFQESPKMRLAVTRLCPPRRARSPCCGNPSNPSVRSGSRWRGVGSRTWEPDH